MEYIFSAYCPLRIPELTSTWSMCFLSCLSSWSSRSWLLLGSNSCNSLGFGESISNVIVPSDSSDCYYWMVSFLVVCLTPLSILCVCILCSRWKYLWSCYGSPRSGRLASADSTEWYSRRRRLVSASTFFIIGSYLLLLFLLSFTMMVCIFFSPSYAEAFLLFCDGENMHWPSIGPSMLLLSLFFL